MGRSLSTDNVTQKSMFIFCYYNIVTRIALGITNELSISVDFYNIMLSNIATLLF